MIFIDTSALYALLDKDDRNHMAAAKVWPLLVKGEEQIVTHSYVVVESVALVQRRLGMKGVRLLLDGLLAVVEVWWVEPVWHRAAVTALLAAGRREISLVDWVSFESMKQHGIDRAFTFDEDFKTQGFALLPKWEAGKKR